ncbi:hypothetical protein WMF31_27205 [Sorangium sp. So ce1036]|uniref:hypothetical protein n=1 Tax=Sorangium sp. So ce1036 TaxID=3133328 RepID=UPI003F11181F
MLEALDLDSPSASSSWLRATCDLTAKGVPMDQGSSSARLSRSRIGGSLSVLLCAPAVALVLVGCGGMDPSSSEADESTPNVDAYMTWEEFKANAHHDPERGIYIIDGDVRGLSNAELRIVYERYVRTGALVVNRSDGADDTLQRYIR